MRSTVWLLPLGMVGFALTMPVIQIILWLWSTGTIWHFLTLWTAVVLLLHGLVALAVSRVLWRYVKSRFLTNVVERCVCFDCGYDLRGNPEATACPECGWAIAWKEAA